MTETVDRGTTMETAEDLAEDVARARLGKGYKIERVGEGSMSERLDAAAKLIEADRAAVTLAAKRELLEEIRDYTAAAYPNSGDWQRRYESLLSFLDTKYTQPGGVK